MTWAAEPPISQQPVASVPRPAPARGESPPSAHGRGPAVRQWTRDEFYEMSRLGWFRGRRVFLLGGEVFEMAGQGNWHSVTIGLALDALEPAFPRGQFWARCQMPLDATNDSEPEPDIAIVPGKPADYAAHPSTALLIVEVADSSLRVDRRKANAYAAAGVLDYWIVDIAGHQVEVYRSPVPDAREPFGHRYDRVEGFRPGATLTPVARPDASIAIADLLPKQPVTDPDA